MLVHDLRSPLNSILGTLDMAYRMIDERADTGEVLDMLKVTISSAQGMLRMVESLLEINRLEGGQALNLQPVSVRDVASRAFEAVDGLARQGNLTLVLDVEPGVPLAVADQDVLQRVLVNLLDNALRYTPDGGEVRVEVRTSGCEVEVCVIDSGAGIQAGAHERIFEKFARDVRPALRGHAGTGLGLAFCRRALDALGGRIWAEDGPKGGAMLAFTLPADPEANML